MYVNRSLKTKTGRSQSRTARRIFGVCVAYLKRHPDAWADLTVSIDFLPREMPLAWYISAVRGLIHEAEAKEEQVSPAIREKLKSLTVGIG